jgi:hypothetical protein
VKGQKKEILTDKKADTQAEPMFFIYFLPNAHFLKQLPTHIAHIAKAPQSNAQTNPVNFRYAEELAKLVPFFREPTLLKKI